MNGAGAQDEIVAIHVPLYAVPEWVFVVALITALGGAILVTCLLLWMNWPSRRD